MNKSQMDKLYSSAEAREKLGNLSTSSFKRLVDAGKIRKVTPPNKKHGMYLREDVDKLAVAMQKFVEVYSTTSTDRIEVVRAQTEDEIRDTAQIARQHFGELAYTAEERIAWFRKVPDGDYVLKYEGVIVGYFSLQAVKPEALADHILRPNGGGVRIDDIIPFSSGGPLECYVTGMAVKLDIHHRTPDRVYGMLLIMGLYDRLVELGKQGINIKTVWTKSRTVSGIKICRDIGFTDLGYLDSEHILFKLDITASDFPAVIRYKEALREASKVVVK